MASGMGRGGSAFQQPRSPTPPTEEVIALRRLTAQVAALAESPAPQVSPFADPRSPTNFGGRLGPRYAMLPPGAAGAAVDRPERSAAVLLQGLHRRAREHRVRHARSRIPNAPAGRPIRSRVRGDLPLSAAHSRADLQHAVGGDRSRARWRWRCRSRSVSRTLDRARCTLRALVLVGLVVVFSAVALLLTGADLSAPRRCRSPRVVGGGRSPRTARSGSPRDLRSPPWAAIPRPTRPILATRVARAGRDDAVDVQPDGHVLYPVPSRVEMVQAMREATG